MCRNGLMDGVNSEQSPRGRFPTSHKYLRAGSRSLCSLLLLSEFPERAELLPWLQEAGSPWEDDSEEEERCRRGVTTGQTQSLLLAFSFLESVRTLDLWETRHSLLKHEDFLKKSFCFSTSLRWFMQEPFLHISAAIKQEQSLLFYILLWLEV